MRYKSKPLRASLRFESRQPEGCNFYYILHTSYIQVLLLADTPLNLHLLHLIATCYDLDNCWRLILTFLGGTGSDASLLWLSSSSLRGLFRGLVPLAGSSSSSLARRGLDLDEWWLPFSTLDGDFRFFSLDGTDSGDLTLSDLLLSLLPLLSLSRSDLCLSFSPLGDLSLSLSYLYLSFSDLSFSDLEDVGDESLDLWWWEEEWWSRLWLDVWRLALACLSWLLETGSKRGASGSTLW